MVAALALAAVLAAAISEVSDGEVPVDEFISYIAAMLMVMAPLRRLVNVGSQLQQGIAAGAGMFEVLDQPREPGGRACRCNAPRGWLSSAMPGFRIRVRRNRRCSRSISSVGPGPDTGHRRQVRRRQVDAGRTGAAPV